MPLWYTLAPIVFVGGSLSDHGGHTPYEPAQFNCAILHGPHISNHFNAYKKLATQQATKEVREAQGLAEALTTLIKDPMLCREKARLAQSALGDSAKKQIDQEGALWAALADIPGLSGLAHSTESATV